MDKLYDERMIREVPQTWKRGDGEYAGVDMFYLRVQLFRAEASVERALLGVDRWPLYFLLEEYESFEGDPDADSDRGPRIHTKKHTYTTGPDSKRIRQAVMLADAFGGKRAYNSK